MSAPAAPPVAVAGAAATVFGRFPGCTVRSLQTQAATAALADADLDPATVDGLLVGYATTEPHLMPASVLAEQLALTPATAAGFSAGGATGLAMVVHAVHLIRSGAADRVLVVAGENRATGQSTTDSMGVLAGVGHRDYEAPLGATVPAYYALLASAYLAEHGLTSADLAPLAVQMRAHAADHPGAHHRAPITAEDVLASRPVADPLRLLDCCPVSDGAAAVVLTAADDPAATREGGPVLVTGVGSAHQHQHLSGTTDPAAGARVSSRSALTEAGVGVADVEYAGIYDSFTITLAMLLEELGMAPPGRAGACAAAGTFSRTGRLPTNTHGGLLSYGHSGVAGGMAHLVEAVQQLRGEAGARQVSRTGSPGHGSGNAATDRPPRVALVHADGGVLSSHATLLLTGPGDRSERAPGSHIPHTAPRTDVALPEPREPTDWTSGVPELRVDVCRSCSTVRYLPRARCPRCGSSRYQRQVDPGQGTVVASTRVHRGLRTENPFTLALVELDSGPRLLARAEAASVGDRVRVSARPVPGTLLPTAEPASGAGGRGRDAE